MPLSYCHIMHAYCSVYFSCDSFVSTIVSYYFVYVYRFNGKYFGRIVMLKYYFKKISVW